MLHPLAHSRIGCNSQVCAKATNQKLHSILSHEWLGSNYFGHHLLPFQVQGTTLEAE